MNRMSMPEELELFIRGEAGRSGYQVLDMRMKGTRGVAIEITLDRQGGITLDECSGFNRTVSAWIDGQSTLTQGYTIDVCSPGLDRELRSESDFTWAEGKEVCVNTFQAVDGRKRFVGRLMSPGEDGSIRLQIKTGEVLNIEKEKVSSARLYNAELYGEV